MGSQFAGTVTIDLGAITENTRALAGRAGGAQVMAVVKADAYGHGLVPSAFAARRGGATWFGVAQLGEALRLRSSGVGEPILCWLYAPDADLRAALGADVDLAVSAPWMLDAIADAAVATRRSARIHIKVDTGLGRNGVLHGEAFTDLVGQVVRAERAGQVRAVGIMQHFAYADAPGHPEVLAQAERFEAAIAQAERAGLTFEVRHAANSAALLTNDAVRYDLVRPGIALYGLAPVDTDLVLTPAMRLSAPLVQVKSVDAGQGLSYAHTYHTPAPTRVGLVPLGYSDGVPRAAGNVGPLAIGDTRLTIGGRVCMDQFMVDLGADSGATEGDEVILFGDPRRGEPSATEWAIATGTIDYEIVTRIGTRIPRVFIGAEAGWPTVTVSAG